MQKIFEKGKNIDFNADYIIWGTGRKCEELLKLCKDNIKIKYCVDREPQKVNGMIRGIPVYPISRIWGGEVEKKKIIIASQAYLKIKEILLKNGISEDDIYFFFEWEIFYSWFKLEKVILPPITMLIGNICNLKCRGCAAYVPYSKNKRNLKFSEMKETIDAFFKIVDYVETISLAGGETLLNNDVGKTIEYLGEKYKEKLGNIEIFTNGTIFPNEEFINICKIYNVSVTISDYSKVLQGRYEEIKNILIENKISYSVLQDFVRDDQMWCWYDMGNPEVIQEKSEVELKELFSKCASNCRMIYDGKLWYCQSMVPAIIGLGIKMEPTDYCDMNKIDKNKKEDVEKFLVNYLGYPEKGYYSMCKRCNGIGAYVNDKFIPAGEQIS